MGRHRPTILIADDHTLVAEACGKLLQPEFDVIGVVPDGQTLLRVAAELLPDVAVVDIAMPGMNGLDAGQQLKNTNRTIKLILLTMSLDPDVAAEAFRRGASGYVVKSGSADELIVAVRRVVRGESFLSRQISHEEVDLLRRSRCAFGLKTQLTTRERDVLRFLAQGKRAKEIAHLLRIRIGTVFFHKYSMMERLGFRRDAELIQYAIQHCL